MDSPLGLDLRSPLLMNSNMLAISIEPAMFFSLTSWTVTYKTETSETKLPRQLT